MNPYKEESHTPKSAKSLFEKYQTPKKRRITERGELLRFFAEKMKRTIPFIAQRVSHLTIKDLYYLKSDCTQAEARNVPFSAAFNKALQVPKK